jgi:transposase-like protein
MTGICSKTTRSRGRCFRNGRRTGVRRHRDIRTSDGAPGIIKAIEVYLPREARQRRLAHRIRNLASKVPEDVWPDFKVRAQATHQASSRARPEYCICERSCDQSRARGRSPKPSAPAMQIKNHDDLPKFDHRAAPSFWAEGTE